MLDRDGDRIGTIEDIYADDRTGQPEWALVKDAPDIAADKHLSEAEGQRLWRHYGLDYGDYGAGDEDTGRDDAMTRSEEELQVGTQPRERGRVRLRKTVKTRRATATVPVEREELQIEREPITDANRDQAMQGPVLSEAEHEVVLHEQRPVTHKEVVPKERVRAGTEKVKDQRKAARKLRKEQIELEEDPTASRR